MKYLKVFTDFVDVIEPLSDAERGRLFTAMLKYALAGEITELKGQERYIWPAAKQNIDRTRAEAEKNAVCGSKGGRPKKPTETDENRKKPTETEKNRKKADKDKDNDKDNIITPLLPKGSIPPKGDTHTRFAKPTIDEVKAYCEERHNNINPQTFVDFYASKGWKVGNQPMRDWKAAVRTWEQKERPQGKPNRQRDMANAREYSDFDAIGNDLLGG